LTLWAVAALPPHAQNKAVVGRWFTEFWERSESAMNCTVACFCGNVYTAPPNRCDECGCTFGESAPSPTASATDGHALVAELRARRAAAPIDAVITRRSATH
jgi:hypothetical protein